MVAKHTLDFRFGMRSPLQRLVDMRANVLQIGTPWTTCTALHLAEAHATYPGRKVGHVLLPLPGAGRTTWTEAKELVYSERDFQAIGEAWVASGQSATGRVGLAEARLSPLPALVDHAAAWLLRHRDFTRGKAPVGYRRVHPAPARRL